MKQYKIFDPRKDIVEAGRELYETGLVVGRTGNISVRLPEDRVLITPAGASLGYLTDDELAVVAVCGGAVEGEETPSTEYKLHLAIYLIRPDVGAIVHTHPAYATVVGYLKQKIHDVNPETREVLGKVNLAPALKHGTQELAVATAKTLGSNYAVMMEKHGAVTVGINLQEAVDRAHYLEQAAKLSYLTTLAAKS